jgi:hypothetical protein
MQEFDLQYPQQISTKRGHDGTMSHRLAGTVTGQLAWSDVPLSGQASVGNVFAQALPYVFT